MKQNGNGDYTSFYDENGDLIIDDDKDILKYLNDIDITIYQESVPVTVTKDNGTELNADINNDGKVDNIEMAKEIFKYFESNPGKESNN